MATQIGRQKRDLVMPRGWSFVGIRFRYFISVAVALTVLTTGCVPAGDTNEREYTFVTDLGNVEVFGVVESDKVASLGQNTNESEKGVSEATQPNSSSEVIDIRASRAGQSGKASAKTAQKSSKKPAAKKTTKKKSKAKKVASKKSAKSKPPKSEKKAAGDKLQDGKASAEKVAGKENSAGARGRLREEVVRHYTMLLNQIQAKGILPEDINEGATRLQRIEGFLKRRDYRTCDTLIRSFENDVKSVSIDEAFITQKNTRLFRIIQEKNLSADVLAKIDYESDRIDTLLQAADFVSINRRLNLLFRLVQEDESAAAVESSGNVNGSAIGNESATPVTAPAQKGESSNSPSSSDSREQDQVQQPAGDLSTDRASDQIKDPSRDQPKDPSSNQSRN